MWMGLALHLWMDVVLEMVGRFCYTSRHDETDLYFDVVPSHGYPNVFFSTTIFGQRVMFFYHLDQVLSVLFSKIFNSKVINYQIKYIGQKACMQKPGVYLIWW